MRHVHFLSVIFLLVADSLHTSNALALNATVDSFFASNGTDLNAMKPSVFQRPSRSRRKRYITQSDMVAILDYHNHVRANVFPPAANMEYMVWDIELARAAEAWAATCWWDHGPAYLLQFYGQNLSVRTGRYSSIVQLVEPWYDEVRHYVFPYPALCTPACPLLCHGPMCTHYTQMVWATTSRVGCAVHTCANMLVWGVMWSEATYLVCNYSSKGNWIGEAPYRIGVPCSSCPPGYGGSCRNNMCFPPAWSNYMYWFK